MQCKPQTWISQPGHFLWSTPPPARPLGMSRPRTTPLGHTICPVRAYTCIQSSKRATRGRPIGSETSPPRGHMTMKGGRSLRPHPCHGRRAGKSTLGALWVSATGRDRDAPFLFETKCVARTNMTLRDQQTARMRRCYVKAIVEGLKVMSVGARHGRSGSADGRSRTFRPRQARSMRLEIRCDGAGPMPLG